MSQFNLHKQPLTSDLPQLEDISFGHRGVSGAQHTHSPANTAPPKELSQCLLGYTAPTRAAAPGQWVPRVMGGSQSQAKEWGPVRGLWAGCLATGREQGGPGEGSWGLPAFPQETLAAFSAVLQDAVWAVSLDVNTEAACGPTQTEEELSLFFLIRDSNTSAKSSTGWLWFAQRHWVAKQDIWPNPHFSFCLQSVLFRVRGWSHTNSQCWSCLTGQLTWVADTWGLIASHVFSGFLSKQLVALTQKCM